jgi:RNA polymerase sigma-70 factor (ECF subfamily)
MTARPDLTTGALIQLAQDGDERALNVLYARYYARLVHWTRGRLPGYARDLRSTEDLVQEVLIRSLRSFRRIEADRPGGFQAYLRRGIMNMVRNEIAASGRRPLDVDADADRPDPSPSPLEETLGREVLERYDAAVGELAPEERAGIILRLELGFSWDAIASELDRSSPDAARMMVSRALVRLAGSMAPLKGPT